MSDLRATVLAEEEIVASKMRFGLFSQPPPIAVGDDSAYKPINHPRGENGKPVTNPPQLLAGTCKKGMVKSSYFGVPESIYAKDPYKDRFKTQIQYERAMHTKASFHEADFKPASGTKSNATPAYKYIEEKSDAQKPIRKDDNGRVITEDKNFTTNPISKVEKQFFKHPKYIEDPFERKSEFEKRYKEQQKKKIPLDTPSFKSMNHGPKPLNKDSSIYGEDAKVKELTKNKKQRVKTMANVYPHETKFKLARLGYGDPFGPYPKFVEPKTKESVEAPRKRVKTQEAEVWKPNRSGLSRPTPSIGLHPTNLHVSKYRR